MSPLSHSRRRVLIVDDERIIRDSLARVLGGHHDVTTADSGAAGLQVLETGLFDVILCDVTMPGMDGREVHRAVAVRYPGLERRIIFMSGGTFQPELDRFLATCGNSVLGKPFGIEALLAVVARQTATQE